MLNIQCKNHQAINCNQCQFEDVFGWMGDLISKAQKRPVIELDYSKIDDVEVDGIDGRDAPDFCDAYISSASYDGRDMTEAELDALNEDSAYVYEAVQNWIY